MEILHDIEVPEFGDGTKVVIDADDVFVELGECTGDLDFASKAGFHAFDGKDIGVEDFDDAIWIAVELDVSCEVHLAKAALCEEFPQSILVGNEHQRELAFEAKGKFCNVSQGCGGFF